MAKDPDRDLVERINSALTEDIQRMLEKVLTAHLKPIIKRLDLIEESFDVLEREQKKQCLECWHTESVCKEEGVCLGFMRKDTDKPVNPPLKPILLGGFAFGVIFFILYCTIAGG